MVRVWKWDDPGNPLGGCPECSLKMPKLRRSSLLLSRGKGEYIRVDALPNPGVEARSLLWKPQLVQTSLPLFSILTLLSLWRFHNKPIVAEVLTCIGCVWQSDRGNTRLDTPRAPHNKPGDRDPAAPLKTTTRTHDNRLSLFFLHPDYFVSGDFPISPMVTEVSRRLLIKTKLCFYAVRHLGTTVLSRSYLTLTHLDRPPTTPVIETILHKTAVRDFRLAGPSWSAEWIKHCNLILITALMHVEMGSAYNW